jgi:hypothetical protein
MRAGFEESLLGLNLIGPAASDATGPRFQYHADTQLA